jgi:hypothetical protein
MIKVILKPAHYLCLFLAASALSTSTGVMAEESSGGSGSSAQERPFGLSLELGGRSLLYSFSLDYQLTPDLRVGAGLGLLSNADFIFFEFDKLKSFPLFGDWSFYRSSSGRGSGFLSLGLSYFQGEISGGSFFEALFESASVDTPTPFQGYIVPLGLGWEYRGHYGFLFRLTTYLSYVRVSDNLGNSDSSLAPVIGMHFGYAF